MSKLLRSSVVIGKLLDSEGFTAHTANAVIKFGRKIAHPTQKERFARTRKAAKLVLRELPEGDKAVIGRFINQLMGMSLQTGVRLGMAACACLNDAEVIGLQHECGTQQEFQDTGSEEAEIKETDFQGESTAAVAGDSSDQT